MPAGTNALMALAAELAHPRRKFDLAHMRALAHALGNPHNNFPSILIAGTNGKGSTAATLASILAASGMTVGLYTSPHLVRPNERIRILTPADPLGEICDAALDRAADLVLTTSADLVTQNKLPHPPSFFEAVTAAALLHFAQSQIHVAVLEVGLGGRLDATNIVAPTLSVITDIALDHTEYLGPTLTDIAREKSGILRPSGTLITLPQHPEANQAIGERAMELHCRGINAAPYMPARPSDETSPESPAFLPSNRYPLTVLNKQILVDSPLPGSHQQRNLALAIAAAVELEDLGYPVTAASIETGIRSTRWPARLERIPTSGAPLLLDAAHNPAGVWALRSALSRIPDATPKTLIFSCLADKPLDEMAQILFPLFASPRDQIIVPPIHSFRAASTDRILALALQHNSRAAASDSPATALATALASTPPQGLIVAAGSIYLLGEIRSALAVS